MSTINCFYFTQRKYCQHYRKSKTKVQVKDTRNKHSLMNPSEWGLCWLECTQIAVSVYGSYAYCGLEYTIRNTSTYQFIPFYLCNEPHIT